MKQLKFNSDKDIRELEKYGFRPEYDAISNKLFGYGLYSTRVWIKDYVLRPRDAHFSNLDYVIIYDLIKAKLLIVEDIDD